MLLSGGIGYAGAQGLLPGMSGHAAQSSTESTSATSEAQESTRATAQEENSSSLAEGEASSQSMNEADEEADSSKRAAESSVESTPESASKPSSESTPEPTPNPETKPAPESESAPESEPAASEQKQNVLPANDVRAAEFALDPAKQDWNYESNGRKVVYLTIDDGPSNLTPQVLDILDRYGVKATFFVVGASPEHYHYIKEAYERGHTIGLHTFSHDYPVVYASVDAYYADLDRIGQVVKEQIGYIPCFIRFPGGSSNMISAKSCPGIMSALVGSVQERGYQYYDWNVSTGDGSVHTADELVDFTKESPLYDNVMLLCHDSATKQTTLEALPRIIEYYQEQGYSFEPISRASIVVQHGVSN